MVPRVGSVSRVAYPGTIGEPGYDMSDIADNLSLQATISDFHRRIRGLEATLHGVEQQPMRTDLLYGLYIDSHKKREKSAFLARMWCRQIFMLDARQLLTLAQSTGDPYPWRPMLAMLDEYLEAGFDTAPARTHLLGAAQDLLNAQGLDLLQPYDLMAHPFAIQVAASAIRESNGEVDGQEES